MVLKIDYLKGDQPTQGHLDEDNPDVYSDDSGNQVQEGLHGLSGWR